MSSIMIISDDDTIWSVTYDRHYDNHNSFMIQATVWWWDIQDIHLIFILVLLKNHKKHWTKEIGIYSHNKEDMSGPMEVALLIRHCTFFKWMVDWINLGRECMIKKTKWKTLSLFKNFVWWIAILDIRLPSVFLAK